MVHIKSRVSVAEFSGEKNVFVLCKRNDVSTNRAKYSACYLTSQSSTIVKFHRILTAHVFSHELRAPRGYMRSNEFIILQDVFLAWK